MANITLRQAAMWCGGTVDEKYADVEFFGANNDTRIIKPDQLFIVLQGARDGHDFIPMAMEKGAAAALCSRKVGDYPAIYVDDPRIALGLIAHEVLKSIGCRVVGVTGSVGKSTTKEMISAVLSSTYRISKTPANHNNDIGMPMAVLSMPEDTQVAVLEMGMNHFREIAYLSNIANPDVAVIINIGTMHIEHLGSQEGILKAKLEILEGLKPEGTVLLNGDDPLLWSVRDQVSRCCGEPESFRPGTLSDPVALLSRRAAQQQAQEELLSRVRPGDVLDARITHLESFGAFADIGCGIVGLISIENISVSRISHPRDRFVRDQAVKVVVKEIDREKKRFVLSHKELLGTWEENVSQFEAGQTVGGIIRSIENYGIFVELAPNLAGLAEIRADLFETPAVNEAQMEHGSVRFL